MARITLSNLSFGILFTSTFLSAHSVEDAQTLDGISDNKFDMWRCDPPYNQNTAQKMYGTNLPITGELLKAGARVCTVGSLLFLLLGPQNYQWCPYGVKRIGWAAITIVPNNELRTLHIFYKYTNSVRVG
jgi:hypothetical protein